ncbi:unnamed protein product [Phaeothamnion confervicola]
MQGFPTSLPLPAAERCLKPARRRVSGCGSGDGGWGGSGNAANSGGSCSGKCCDAANGVAGCGHSSGGDRAAKTMEGEVDATAAMVKAEAAAAAATEEAAIPVVVVNAGPSLRGPEDTFGRAMTAFRRSVTDKDTRPLPLAETDKQ